MKLFKTNRNCHSVPRIFRLSITLCSAI